MTDHNITAPPFTEAPRTPDTQSAYRLAGIPSTYIEPSFSSYREKISRMNLIELCAHAAEVEVTTSCNISVIRDRLERKFLDYHSEHREEAEKLTQEARERQASMSLEERAALITDSDRFTEEARRCREILETL